MLSQIKIAFWGILLGLTLVWGLANFPLPETLNFISVRSLVLHYSGVLGIGTMSAAMLLALRSIWLEPKLGGLDKSYRLHKWLGIAALIASLIHWLAANSPRWLVAWGLRERGSRPSRPEPDGFIEGLFRGLRGEAELVGEWAFYAVIVLIILALIKRFPYRLFAKTHKIIAVVYIALVMHTIVLMKFSAWSQPLGLVTILMLVAGTCAAVLVLADLIGKKYRANGIIESQHYFSHIKVLETVIVLDKRWRGHKSGQFAFVCFDKKEGHHPFTIASAWDPSNPKIVFITKGLGDYTDLLPERLSVGDKAVVEGPYGEFTFDDQSPRQIWVAGGIGVTPFIARMKHLAQHPSSQPIDLFHCVKEIEDDAIAKLSADAAAAKVNLHMVIHGKDERLTGERLRNLVPDWKQSSTWFCGPTNFGAELRKDLVSQGLSPTNFHQELFDMR